MDYFDTHVLINLRRYEEAEANLTRAHPDHDVAAGEAMVAAMNLATAAYHLADHIFAQYAATKPAAVYGMADLPRYRDYLDQNRCKYVGNPNLIVDDLSLLGAVVDAYKHYDLRNKSRPVTSANATVVVESAWGELPWGEGKWGGIAQVIVRPTNKHPRALSKVFQNVIEMWKQEIQTHGL